MISSLYSGTGSGIGIIVTGTASPTIINNTLIENPIALNMYNDSHGSSSMVAFNNFEGNSKFNIRLGQEGIYGSTASDVNASYNWWGTTDIPIINQTICDHKNGFNLGTVTFVPLLRAANVKALPDSNAPIPTPVSTISPTSPTPNQSTSPTQNHGNL